MKLRFASLAYMYVHRDSIAVQHGRFVRVKTADVKHDF